MSDTLFVQFYESKRPLNKSVLFLNNGFSSAYDICKTKGDFYWVDINGDLKLPITKGTVFASAFFISQLNTIIDWAIENPDIKFIVGGPAISTGGIKFIDAIPTNINFESVTVEEYFGKEPYSYPFRLVLSDPGLKNIDDDLIVFTYTLDNSCYWGKCRFCNYYFEGSKRKSMDFSFIDDIEFSGLKQVRINCPSLTPKLIKEFYSKVKYRDDVIYDMLLRCNNPEYLQLKEVYSNYKGEIPKTKIRLGVEFPSDRILRFIRKGFNMNEIYNMLDLLDSYGIMIYTLFINGWPGLTQEDVDSLEQYKNRSPKAKMVAVFDLFCLADTYFHDFYIDRKPEIIPNRIYNGYYPILTEDEIKMNAKSRKIFENLPSEAIIFSSKGQFSQN